MAGALALMAGAGGRDGDAGDGDIRAVLFACSLNAIRSPIAAAITKARRPDLYVASAGVARGYPDGFANAVAHEAGLSLDDHDPHTITDLGDLSFDLVVTLSDEARNAVERLARTNDLPHEHWSLPDPSDALGSREQRLSAYRAIRDELTERVAKRFG